MAPKLVPPEQDEIPITSAEERELRRKAIASIMERAAQVGDFGATRAASVKAFRSVMK